MEFNMTVQVSTMLRRIVLSVIPGFSISFVLALQFFGYDTFSPLDQLFLVCVPALSTACLIYYFLPSMEGYLARSTVFVRFILVALVFSAGLVTLLLSSEKSMLLLLVSLISQSTILLMGIIPAIPYIQYVFQEGLHVRMVHGWLLALAGSSLCVGILASFYFHPFQIILLTLLLQFGGGLCGYFLVERIRRFALRSKYDFMIALGIFVLISCFALIIFYFGQGFPTLFTPAFFIMKANIFVLFWSVSLFCLPWLAFVLYQLSSRSLLTRFQQTEFYSFIDGNVFGILLASCFFPVYLLIASVINRPVFDVDDIFFDADGMNWRNRLATDLIRDFYWRSIHPFVELLLKPPIELLAKFLNGDAWFAALLLVAFAGALCVFLCWIFIRDTSGNSTYAALVASLLGLSASHLVFGSLIETYIFLAASIMLFYVFLLKEKPFFMLVLAGLPAIGITVTNFAQNLIALFFLRPNFKFIFRYVLVIGVLFVQLSLLNNLLYPDSHPFIFVPSGLLAERQNIFPLTILRAQALVRNFVFYNVVSPEPILYFGDIPFTQFRFFKPEINQLSSYDTTLQTFTAWFWMALLALAGISFLINFKQNRQLKFMLAFLGCILFNVMLHLRYGKELFLYSPNWTYALILLLGLAWSGFSKKKWFLALLLIFVFLLAANNGTLLYTLVKISSLPPG
jgi:hypothetical protein